MTQLEKDLHEAWTKGMLSSDIEKDGPLKLQAVVAKRYIESIGYDLYNQGVADGINSEKRSNGNHIGCRPHINRWLKSNGITSDAKEDPLESAIPSSSFEGRLLSLKQTYESEIAFRDSIIKDLKTRLREL